MKKIFTLLSMAFFAISVNAQDSGSENSSVEKIDVCSAEVKALIETSIANPTVLNSPLYISVTKEEKIYPAGTYIKNNYEAVTGGSPIGLKNYAWEASTTNVTLKANSTLNADSENNAESWQFSTTGTYNEETKTYGNTSLTVTGCDPEFTNYICAKTGNPSAAYKQFYEYPSKKTTDAEGNEINLVDENGNYVSDEDGEPIFRLLEPVWEPGQGDLPAKGCFYEFTSKKDGVLKLAIFLNKNLANNKLYIIDESTKEEGYKALTNDQLTIKGFRQNFNFETESDRGTSNLVDWTLTDEYLITTANIANGGTNRPFYGYVAFNVKANVTYMALTPKSQLGLYGFSFTPSDNTGISSLKSEDNSNAPIYNLAGQKVSDEYKGLIIQNGKKSIKK